MLSRTFVMKKLQALAGSNCAACIRGCAEGVDFCPSRLAYCEKEIKQYINLGPGQNCTWVYEACRILRMTLSLMLHTSSTTLSVTRRWSRSRLSSGRRISRASVSSSRPRNVRTVDRPSTFSPATGTCG